MSEVKVSTELVNEFNSLQEAKLGFRRYKVIRGRSEGVTVESYGKKTGKKRPFIKNAITGASPSMAIEWIENKMASLSTMSDI